MHKIRLAARSKSLAKIGPIRSKDYIFGQKYKIWFEVENVGETPFPGGVLRIQIAWPQGLIVGHPFTIKSLGPGEQLRTKIFDTDALAPGFALFYARPIEADDKKKVEMYRTSTRKFRPLTFIPPRPKVVLYHVHSIYAKQREEITGYWAMWISAVSLTILVIATIVQFIVWFVQFLD